MMRRWLVSLICAASMTAQAQTFPVTAQMLMPNPLGVILFAGQWLMQDNKRVYYIRVRAEGPNFVTARQNGLRLAVEQAVGTLVLSETQVQNQRIVRDEIITYAAGFVDRYTLVDADYVNGVNRVTMDVWVSESRIANRLLNESVGTGTIDGSRLALQVETLQHEHASGDRVVETVLRDFPNRAFDVKVDRSNLEMGSQRNLQIDIPFTVSWNRTYLDSLFESLRRVSAERAYCWWPTHECTRRERSQFTINGLAFNDMMRPAAVVKHMAIDQKPAVELAIVDAHGRVLYQNCQGLLFSNMENMPYNVPNRYFFRVNDRTVHIDNSYRVSGRFFLNLGSDAQRLSTAQKIQVRVVPEKQCVPQ
jgi:hypothetical protein